MASKVYQSETNLEMEPGKKSTIIFRKCVVQPVKMENKEDENPVTKNLLMLHRPHVEWEEM